MVFSGRPVDSGQGYIDRRCVGKYAWNRALVEWQVSLSVNGRHKRTAIISVGRSHDQSAHSLADVGFIPLGGPPWSGAGGKVSNRAGATGHFPSHFTGIAVGHAGNEVDHPQ